MANREVTPLKDSQVKNALPKEKKYTLPDGNGLQLLIKPDGKKIWEIRYTVEGKPKATTAGSYPAVSLAKARAKRDELKSKVNNGIVEQVIVAEQDFINTLPDAGSWIQTSYNTYGGQHTLCGEPFRKNFAGSGITYDETRDAFIPPSPGEGWVLNEDTCLWEDPTGNLCLTEEGQTNLPEEG